MDDAVVCPHCGRPFAPKDARWQHAKSKHGRKAGAALRPGGFDRGPPSIGKRLVDGIEAAACGEPVEPDIAAMFPDQIAAARRGFRP